MLGQTNEKIISNKLQRKLRNEMTTAENALWKVLRARQLEGVKFRRQHPFGNYILDFVCLEIMLVIEVDGGQHTENREYDTQRTEELQKAGYRVLRFWNNQVLQQIESVKEKLWEIVEDLRQTNPSPY